METAETKTVDNQTAAAPQQYTIVPDDSKPIFEDDTLLCELCACGHLPPSLHTTRLTPALPFPPPTSRVSDPSTLTFDQPLSTCPSLPRASPSRLPRRNWLHPTIYTTTTNDVHNVATNRPCGVDGHGADQYAGRGWDTPHSSNAVPLLRPFLSDGLPRHNRRKE